MIKLWSIGQYDYTDTGVEKPVVYNQEFLRQIAENTGTIDITDEHTDKVIGSLSDFKVEGGALYCNVPSDIDVSGKGLSPVFNCDFVDKGKYYEPINFTMASVGLTENPRSEILYNSIKKVGDEKVSDELRAMLDKKEETIAEQREEIGVLNKQIEEFREKLASNEATKKDFAKLQKDFDELQSKTEDYKAIADKFNAEQDAKKEELIKELTGGDEKGMEMFKKHTVEELEYMRDTKIITEPNKGVGASQIDEDKGDQPQEEEIDKYSAEYFEQWEKANTNW